MPFLHVPEATIYYEVHGEGPPLVLVPGGRGTAEVFRALLPHLTARYTVVLMDRRGFLRSKLLGPQDGDKLASDIDDIHRLIEALEIGPATVFGSSSGAVVTLGLMAAHPESVQTMIAHEPAAVSLLPDDGHWVDFFARMYAVYRESGMPAAYELFREHGFAEVDKQAMKASVNLDDEETRANSTHWFENELRQYTAVQLDTAAIAEHSQKFVAAGGEASAGFPTYEVARLLADKTGTPVLQFPGGHIGYATHPAEFAQVLLRFLDGLSSRDSDKSAPRS
ncbi:alpha/beta fold hydrolase [Nitratireductor pacificus]|uniref:Alpha/beta hydrolase fold protein n=1 Tax=Nitratireductor pacificus pht-3B TaxID=391937 RepID=K2LT88_9HYPH|nr:alpha/beta hydrolase [Nitratireductor pacificus]EKF21004.1 alpha/beta hydrolase fold protein [Nitratireductor pacificus pht-3B]